MINYRDAPIRFVGPKDLCRSIVNDCLIDSKTGASLYILATHTYAHNSHTLEEYVDMLNDIIAIKIEELNLTNVVELIVYEMPKCQRIGDEEAAHIILGFVDLYAELLNHANRCQENI